MPLRRDNRLASIQVRRIFEEAARTFQALNEAMEGASEAHRDEVGIITGESSRRANRRADGQADQRVL